MILYIVRHGETRLNVEGRLQGRVDEPLNEKGLELTADPENENKTILIATHGCAMRAMLNPFYPNPDNFWQSQTPPNCCVSIVEVKEGRSTILESDRIYYDPALSQDPYGDD